jgi:DNA (cytosine-5)-methyltransferase 1
MLKAISVFTGVGGLDFGFEAAGFKTVVAVEMDAVCCRALRLNRRWPVVERNIHEVGSNELLHVAKLKEGEADVLVGGPPCQPFSKSGYWARGDAMRLDDPRSGTLTAYLRVLRDAQPKSFLLENVSGLAFRGKSEGLDRFLAGVEQVNRETGSSYRPVWQVVDAASYGVPQRRERVLIVASRDGKEFRFPEAMHGESNDLVPYRTTWDALGDLPERLTDPALELRGKWADLLPSVPEGENYLWHTARGGGMRLFGWRTRYWSFLLKLAKNRPSWTIQAQPGPATGPFHWTNRRLSARELCRLQTFPDDLQFNCSRNDIQRMLGNAVPSLLAEVIGREIRKQLLGKTAMKEELQLLPLRREPVPRPESVAKVPAVYHILVGNHNEHPGEGLGNRARQRVAA